MGVSHSGAEWVDGEDWSEPVWPGTSQREKFWQDEEDKGEVWDREMLESHYKEWVKLSEKGVGVHYGEILQCVMYQSNCPNAREEVHRCIDVELLRDRKIGRI